MTVTAAGADVTLRLSRLRDVRGLPRLGRGGRRLFAELQRSGVRVRVKAGGLGPIAVNSALARPLLWMMGGR